MKLRTTFFELRNGARRCHLLVLMVRAGTAPSCLDSSEDQARELILQSDRLHFFGPAESVAGISSELLLDSGSAPEEAPGDFETKAKASLLDWYTLKFDRAATVQDDSRPFELRLSRSKELYENSTGTLRLDLHEKNSRTHTPDT